ncbi:MAG: hypothetical protein ACLRWM_15000 [Streptococcus sp.]
MSRADNSAGLILASSPIFKKVFGKSNVGRAYDLPFDVQTRRFSYYNAKRQGLRTDPEYVRFIEDWAKVTFIVPPRMDEYISVNMEIQGIFQNYGSPNDIYPYSIDEGFIDLSSSLNYFVPEKQLSRKQKLDLISARIRETSGDKLASIQPLVCPTLTPYLLNLPLIMKQRKHQP